MGRPDVRLLSAVYQRERADDAVPCVEAFSGFARDTKFLGKINFRRYCGQDGVSDFVLDHKEVIDVSVIPLSPDLAINKSVHEAHRDADAITHMVQTAFQQVPCPQVT